MSKFLFYFEIHPIRNKFDEFAGVIEYWKNFFLNNTEHQMMLYANNPTIINILQRYPELQRFILYPTDEDNEFIESQATEWDKGGILKWKLIMEGKGSAYKAYCSIIKSIHKKYPFNYIVCWGTNKAVKETAKKLKVGFVNMELGFCRLPFCDTLVADPMGVNGASVFAKSDIADFKSIEGNDNYRDLLYYSRDNISDLYIKNFKLVPQQLKYLVGKPKIAFIPLQLYDDANLIQYSPYNKVIDVLQDILPKLHKKGYFCVIKEHPASRLRKGSENANRKAQNYATQFDNTLWLGEEYQQVSNIFWFQISEVVVTVNSSTGFEALFYDKPVIVLGEASYKVRGVFPSLENYLKRNFDLQTYLINIAKIRKFFMEYYLINQKKTKNIKQFINRLILIGDMSKENLTPKNIIEKLVNNKFDEI